MDRDPMTKRYGMMIAFDFAVEDGKDPQKEMEGYLNYMIVGCQNCDEDMLDVKYTIKNTYELV